MKQNLMGGGEKWTVQATRKITMRLVGKILDTDRKMF